MSSSLNECKFIGNLGKDPDVRYMPSGGAVANFSIACTETWKDRETGQKKESTEWINIVAFNKLAEICGEYLRSGSKIYCSGKYKTRKWEKDGITRYSTEVHIKDMIMLGGKPSSGSGDYAQASQGSTPAPDQDFDDALPF